jgi:ribosomal protein S18 acetylase RimI-like enzyme
MSTVIMVKAAKAGDLPALGKMAGGLVRLHHTYDARRFMLPPDVEAGYRWWFGKELRNKKARILVATTVRGRVLGYAYARLEPTDWNALRESCCALHDLWVEPRSRQGGIARQLVDGICAWATEHGAPRVVLSSASANKTAQKFFKQAGFRPTMVEMTREIP